MESIKLLIVTFLLLSGSAIAHSGLQSSIPNNGDVLKETPQVVEFNYSGPVNLMKVEIKGGDGNLIDLDLPSDNQPRKNFTLPLPDLQSSVYQVNWVSAGADGHKIKGKFSFKYSGANSSTSQFASDDLEPFSANISIWSVGILINKLLLYIALAMTIGGLAAMFTVSRYNSLQIPFISYLPIGCILGVSVASLGFFLQVGAFAEEGISGMWSQDYLPVLWETGAGKAFRYQLLGWCFTLGMMVLIWLTPRLNHLFSTVALIGGFLIAGSFTLTGHTTEAPTWVRIALVLHVMTAMWWIGSLYPLRCACNVLNVTNLQSLMVEFGRQAMVLVGLLIVLGVGVAYHLEGSFSNLLFTGHGNILLLKIASVAAILFIAARHKWRLVPGLTSHQAVKSLKHSITIEMFIGFVILLITAALSSLAGPAYG